MLALFLIAAPQGIPVTVALRSRYDEALRAVRGHLATQVRGEEAVCILVLARAMVRLPRGQPLHKVLLSSLLSALAEAARLAPDALRDAGLLGSELSEDPSTQDVFDLAWARVDRFLDWLGAACRDAVHGGPYRRVLEEVLPQVADGRQVRAALDQALRALRRKGVRGLEGQEVFAEYFARPWLNALVAGGDGRLNLAPAAAADVVARARWRRQGAVSLDAPGVTGPASEPPAPTPTPEEAVAAAEWTHLVVEAVQAALRARAALPARSTAVRCARAYLGSILRGELTQADVARLEGCDKGELSRAVSAELAVLRMDPLVAHLALGATGVASQAG